MYPTLEQVEQASHIQLARWHRFLPSPGSRAIGQDNFQEVFAQQAAILDRIEERFKELGGMTPEISKGIGWE